MKSLATRRNARLDLGGIAVKDLAKKALKGYKNINNVAKLLDLCNLHSARPVLAHEAFVTLAKLFSKLYARSEFESNEENELGEVVTWVKKNFGVYKELAITILNSSSDKFRAAAISVLIDILKVNTKVLKKFDNILYERILVSVFSQERSEAVLSAFISKHKSYGDLKYYFCVSSKELLKRNENYLECIYVILTHIEPNGSLWSSWSVSDTIKWKQAFSKLWFDIMCANKDDKIKKDILIRLPKLMPHLSVPEAAMDFVVKCYEKGNVFGVLALSALQKLIVEYNIEYPNYYLKLYALLTDRVLHMKYRSRFLRLVYRSLMSPELPTYLVSAFLKKLSRMCLTSPAPGVLETVPIIYNLIKLHPACLFLIHKNKNELQEDLYLENEEPKNSRVMDSCLWELLLLEKHNLEQIQAVCRKFREDLSQKKTLLNVEDFLDSTYDNLLSSLKGYAQKKTSNAEKETPTARHLSAPISMRLPCCAVSLA